jgi:hypothetical protein
VIGLQWTGVVVKQTAQQTKMMEGDFHFYLYSMIANRRFEKRRKKNSNTPINWGNLASTTKTEYNKA